jgi:hypothetical protein
MKFDTDITLDPEPSGARRIVLRVRARRVAYSLCASALPLSATALAPASAGRTHVGSQFHAPPRQ